MERQGLVTLGGKPVTLVGNEVSVGQRLPDVSLTGNDMAQVKLSDFSGKVIVLLTVPSLDTPVCSLETARFDREIAATGGKVALVTVSVDLPFAQKRWCLSNNGEAVVTLSDYRERSLGLALGVLLKEPLILARTVWVVDKEGIVRYIEIVPEIGKEPDYSKALEAAKKLVG